MCKCPAHWKCPWRCKPWPSATSFDALVALGCIIRGETYHFELVANESGAGVTACRAGLPASQLPTRSSPPKTWSKPLPAKPKKAPDAARVAVEMANYCFGPQRIMHKPRNTTQQRSAKRSPPSHPRTAAARAYQHGTRKAASKSHPQPFA